MDPFSSALRATCTAAVAMLAWVGRRLCAGLVGHCWAAFATERWNRCGSDRGGPIYKNRGFHSPRRLSFHYSCRSNSGAESSREDAPRTLHVLRNCLLVALTPPVKTAERRTCHAVCAFDQQTAQMLNHMRTQQSATPSLYLRRQLCFVVLCETPVPAPFASASYALALKSRSLRAHLTFGVASPCAHTAHIQPKIQMMNDSARTR